MHMLYKIKKEKAYEELRHTLVFKMGIVKAYTLSHKQLDILSKRMKRRADELSENPLIIYDMVDRVRNKYK